jgi:uncharacterized protein
MTGEAPKAPDGPKIVQAYGDGGFRVSGKRFTHSIILFPTRVLAWDVETIDRVDIQSLEVIAEAPEAVDILLIGSGNGVPRIPQSVRDALRPKGVVIDVMDTGAACRTFNLLISDSRQVAAALIAI